MTVDCDIDILKNAEGWPAHADDLILKAVHHVWAKIPEGAAVGQMAELSVTLSDNGQVQELNREWRGKDTPTNVLSFAAEEGDDDFIIAGMENEMPRLLGDIVFAVETVVLEAQQHHKSFDHHLIHLVMHGMLHLLGYDHIEEDEAEEMEALETSFLAEFGINDPYYNGAGAPD